ncbi:stage II sporulation protein M [Paenibacillus agricola]|uniref:Stage II sporulation protein M n=1 Tax=Paenibacillus agricola TaxID=2716264 RepID=A0ABX0JII6_9BACL|nr:stage II sporulation protein M [Paenibacillus agricola]NHN35179.1 stage II sporulation protein M [Paenibacillus agricola]
MEHIKKQMRVMKHYFIASTLVFVVGLILGAGFSDSFQVFIESQLKGLEQLTQSIANKPNPQWSIFWLIFWNNIVKTLLIIALGAFFGVLPLFFLLANGMLLGYIGAVSTQKESLLFVIKGIAPHGIIEIPAIIIAAAFGLRLGVLMMKGMALLISPARANNFKEDFRGFVKVVIPVAITLIVALTVAAVIESTFTYWLVKS